MAFLKDLLVMGPARFIEDIYGTIEFANKLKTPRAINGTNFDGSDSITTSTWGPGVTFTVKDNDGSHTWTSNPIIGSSSTGVELKLPATIKATLSGNASTATKLSTSTTLKIGNTSKSFDGSETSAIEWTHTQIGASVSNTLTPSGESIGLITTVNEVAANSVSIAGASATQAGLVTTGAQEFKGAKSFTNGHLYLKGATSSSAANTTQIVFVDKDSGTEHIALSSNDDTFCINPSSSSTSGQIVLYLNQASSFPKGITIGSGSYFTGNLSGTASNATQAGKLSHNVTIGLSGDITGSVTTNFAENTSYTISTSLSANYAGSSTKGGAATSALKLVNSSGTAYSLGSISNPVYFSNGIPVECSKVSNIQQAIPYIVGPATDTTAGTWTGSYDGITELTNGLTIIYVPAVAGASTTTLNINGLGAKTCYYTNTSKLTTHFSVNTPIMLTYVGGTWKRADYDSNTNTQIRVYRYTDTSYNGDYPILVSRTATSDIATVGTNASYESVYGVIAQDGQYTPTINPYTGIIKAQGINPLTNNSGTIGTSSLKWNNIYATTFTGNVTGNVSGSSGSCTGNAATATKWKETITLGLLGEAGSSNPSSVSIDGSESKTLNMPSQITKLTKLESDILIVEDNVTLQYNATKKSLDFVFA